LIEFLKVPLTPMAPQNTSEEGVMTQLKKTKDVKAAGPDGFKPDLFTAMMESANALGIMTSCLNKILINTKVP
jgi:hypothetical protein